MLFPGEEEDPGRGYRLFCEALLRDRAFGKGWGELAKKYHMGKSNLRRLVLKLLQGSH